MQIFDIPTKESQIKFDVTAGHKHDGSDSRLVAGGGDFSTGEYCVAAYYPMRTVEATTTSTSYTGSGGHSEHPIAVTTWEALVPAGFTPEWRFLIVVGNNTVGQTGYAKLYDETAAADVANSEISYTSATGSRYTTKTSSAITLVNNHAYGVLIKCSGGTGVFYSGYQLLLLAKKT
jgi:hypothetical protein